MNIAKILKNAVGAALSGILILGFQSCKDNKVNETVDLGTVQGTVTDEQGLPLTDVLVSVSGSELTALTAVDGTYVISDVPMQKQSIIFTKDGFAQVSASVNSSNFKDRVAQLDVVMIMSGGVIRGKCINSSGEPYSGVEVSLNDGAARTTTGSDGIYEFGNLTIDNYTLVFRMTDCADVKRTVSSEQFTSELGYVVELSDVVMGAKQVLRGQTAEDLSHADIWHYNEYRGGKNGDDYPHFDWSSDFLCTLTGFWGNWEEQNEGTTLQIRNNESEGDWTNPVDLKVFDSYLAGRKLITEDNCKMYLKVRTHNATEEDMEKACKIAEAYGFIMSFPDKYDSIIGQSGVNVSGGQRQRLCIARAILREPKILIFDDSLSAIDTVTESKIKKSLTETLSNTTKIIITQKISSIINADKIIVLDSGKISGIGTHGELVNNNAIYKEIYELQLNTIGYKNV